MAYFADAPAPDRRRFPELSDREREVLELIARGMSNQQIVDRLVISPKTVRNHVSNIFSKMQVRDRAEAVVRAREAGLGGERPRDAAVPAAIGTRGPMTAGTLDPEDRRRRRDRPPSSRRPPMPARPAAWTALAVVAWLFAGCIVVQVFLAGLGVFDSPRTFLTHHDFGYLFGWLTLVMLLIAAVRPPGSAARSDSRR